MATPAQIEANRLNAQHSTGPRTPEGKAAVAQNRTTHGLTGAFSVLPCEGRDAYRELLDSYIAEYEPATPTERFFVTELAQAQWRIMRADAIEAELLSPGENATYGEIAAAFRDGDALTRLGRYAQSARRAYYKAQEKLEATRREASNRTIRERREETRDFERRLAAYLDAPPPSADRPVPIPLPIPLQREVDALRRRIPDFDPHVHKSVMSERLRNWLKNYPLADGGNCDSNPIPAGGQKNERVRTAA